MSKVRFLTILVIALILANVAMGFFLMKRKHPPRPELGPRNRIIEALKFDENQIREFDKLVAWHQKEVSAIDEKIVGVKTKLYQTLLKSDSSSLKDSLLNELGKIQVDVEKTHYKHFQDIKALCKPDQQKEFMAFVDEIRYFFRHRPGAKNNFDPAKEPEK